MNVFDASVYLAILFKEPTNPETHLLLRGSVLSTVNYAEVLTRAKQLGLPPDEIIDFLYRSAQIEPFTASQARITADLRPLTAHAGLSFADRACLALAIELGANVYTADRQWSKIQLPCKIILIR